MSYTTGIPTVGQSLGNSRPQVQNNFNYIATAFAINHMDFNIANVGRHKVVDMQEQGANATPPANFDSIFTKVVGTPALGELFYVRGTAGPPNTPIQMTLGNIKAAANGYSFLPGGILVQWGNTTASGTGTRNIVFLTDGNIDFPTACWHVFVQSHDTVAVIGASTNSSNILKTGFNLKTNGNTPSGTSFSWFAIGN